MKKSLFIALVLSTLTCVEANAQYAKISAVKQPKGMEIVQIDLTPNSLLVHCKYTNYGQKKISINEKCYIADAAGVKYNLINSTNLPVTSEAETKCQILDFENQIHCFSLEFEKLPDSIRVFDIIEDKDDAEALNFLEVAYDTIRTPYIDIVQFTAKSPLKEFGRYVEKGNPMFYYKHVGVIMTVGIQMNNNYGKYYATQIDIKNFTNKNLLFDPQTITAQIYNEKKEMHEDLPVLSYTEYMKKVKNKQAWGAALYGFAQGLAAQQAGQSNSTTQATASGQTNTSGTASARAGSTTTYGSYGSTSYSTAYGKSNTQSYSGGAAYAAQQNATNNVNVLVQEQAQIQEYLSVDYLQEHTIRAQTGYSGYLNIKFVKTDNLLITIPIGDNLYVFDL